MATRSNLFPALSIVLLLSMTITTIETSGDLCPAVCKCEDEFLRASCAYANLEVVPIQLNPEIHHLDLSINRITSLNLGFGFYNNLESLDLSYNILHTLGSDNFLLQTHMEILNVSNNNLRTIGRNSLRGLESLRIFDLNNNNITEMDSTTFRHTSELEDLNLSGNSLTSLPNDLFKNLHKIRNLKLNRNSLLEVPANNLHLVPSLENLELSDNLIQEISHDSLPTLRSLMSLNLANNLIQIINEEAFQRLPALVYLNLEGNNLTYVPTSALSHLSLLSNLILSRNPLERLDNLAFRNLFELKTIDLRECTILYIKSRAFADNVNLEKIFLDGNHDLRHLPSRILYSARYLTTVSLRHCNLSSLEPTHFPVDGLNLLQIGGNPLICNCSLHWLWNVIHTTEENNGSKLVVDRGEIVCADDVFNGKLLMNLTESSLRCRLSSLYLSLLAAGCLTAAAIILILAGYITRNNRRKKTFNRPTRPELLVYVGLNEDVPKRTLVHSPINLDLYRSPLSSSSRRVSNTQRSSNNHNDMFSASFYQTQPNNRDLTLDDTFNEPIENLNRYRNSDLENLGAVNNDPNLQKSEVYDNSSVYGVQNSNVRCQKSTTDSDYEYEYYSSPMVLSAQKPHIVFV
ncbi:slit homolog 1 protein-like [Cotesia glomerata]|uniref:Uncharacterized protein n=1 Tax=Cotesia glomerata TaxID=32391 RepID=A0AAV7ITA2_COTGL|nr:slit homolog 1 protein-like [Cotesia glomerata]KAH0557382.1 hypothetical protein KQX54_004925 [Cotesia glomerata]